MVDPNTSRCGMETCNILVIGRSGNGKSSVAYSLMDPSDNIRETRPILSNTEIRCSIFTAEKENLKIIDCTGIADSDEDLQMDISSVSKLVRDIVNTCDPTGGVAAIVFVLKYGVRYTKQEKDAVERVKEIFGQNVFDDLVVIAFSYGDLFNFDVENERYSFEDWCLDQAGDIKDLFKEVHNRCVLIDNKTRDKHKRNEQRRKVFQYIQCLNEGNLEKENEASDVNQSVKNESLNSQMITKKFTSKDFEWEFINQLDIKTNTSSTTDKVDIRKLSKAHFVNFLIAYLGGLGSENVAHIGRSHVKMTESSPQSDESSYDPYEEITFSSEEEEDSFHSEQRNRFKTFLRFNHLLKTNILDILPEAINAGHILHVIPKYGNNVLTVSDMSSEQQDAFTNCYIQSSEQLYAFTNCYIQRSEQLDAFTNCYIQSSEQLDAFTNCYIQSSEQLDTFTNCYIQSSEQLDAFANSM
ncbi:hypothetical protein Btru_048153 [Bulinus truncatus]|nr:hypothetical protein Btru_048153 [Bulinus truncatus]